MQIFTMYIIFLFIAYLFKVLNVLDAILQKIGIKLLRVTKEKVLKGRHGIVKYYKLLFVIERTGV